MDAGEDLRSSDPVHQARCAPASAHFCIGEWPAGQPTDCGELLLGADESR